EMIVQIGTDGRQIAHDLDPHLAQMRARAEARELKQVRRTIRAPADNDLSAGVRHASAAGRIVLQADGTIVLDQDASGLAAPADNEIRARSSRFQIGLGGAPASASGGGCLVVTHALLLWSIEIIGPRDANMLCGCDHRICQCRTRYWIRHIERTADA